MRKYKKPVLNVEQFTANEFIAACGDQNKVYKFTCDAGDGEYGGVYQETNRISGLQIGTNGDKQISRGETSFHACGETHEASTTSSFIQNCYYIPKSAYNHGFFGIGSSWDTSKAIDVVVWRGKDGNNTHCTTHLNMDTWETAKS